MSSELIFYGELLVEIKDRIRKGQTRAALSANAEMIAMYWDIGRIIHLRQKEKGWGAGVIPRLTVDLKNELPEIKGFSERNIGYMIRFAREYGTRPILQQPVAKLAATGSPKEKVPQPAAQLLEKNDLLICATARCTNSLGSQYPADGESQEPFGPPLVYAADN